MGNGTSKEEQLYQAVANSNHNAVKALRRDGASLEFVDKEGRTPLILACTRGDLFEMALTLLNLGANIKAYRFGTYGGYPLHHAAKRGLDKTVLLLLSRGADPLAVNDDSLTPLHMARSRGHVAVIRMIEDRICIFGGVLRELSGPGFLEAIAPQWMTKKIWAVILPTETDPRRVPKFELVIYQAPKVPLPRTIISLSKAEVEEPKFNVPDPVVIILDRNTKSKYKFLAEMEGDKAQLERFYKSCKGISQTAPGAGQVPLSKKAILQDFHSRFLQAAAQLHTQAFDEEPPGPPATSEKLRNRKEYVNDGNAATKSGIIHSTCANEAGPSQISAALPVPESEKLPALPMTLPSAPPLPVHHRSQEEPASVGEEKGSQCVVCWNAAAQGVCIPCGHLAGCMECLGMIKTKGWGCPVCRADIEQVIRVYAV